MKRLAAFLLFAFFALQSFSQLVGISTPTPGGKLQINHKSTSVIPSLLLFDSTAGTGSGIQFTKQSFTSNYLIYSNITGNTASGNLLHFQHSGGTPIMSLKGDNKVGINQSNPARTLDVNGDANIAGKLFINNNVGNAGQVLTSNGAGANPEWRNTAFGSVSRFLVPMTTTSSATAGSGLNENGPDPQFDTIQLSSPQYLYGSDISYNTANEYFTINTNGLYHFEGFGVAHLSDEVLQDCRASIVLSIDPAAASSYNVRVADARLQQTSATVVTGDLRFSTDIYLEAGTTVALIIYFYYVDYAGGPVLSMGVLNAAPTTANYVSGYKISD